MKKQLTSVALAAALSLAAFSSAQAEGLSFNIGAVSLYKSNGIDQDDRGNKSFNPAIQGGVDYDFGNGFYVGNWNSTGKFGNGANLEIDLYGGYSNELSNGLSYDVGVARYIYPGNTSGYNANEWYASFSYGILTAKIARGFGNGNGDRRVSLSVEQPISDALTLKAAVGKRNSDHSSGRGAADFSLGVSYDMGSDMALLAMLSGAQKSRLTTPDAGKTRLVVGVSKSF